ncbi:3-keto-5-aminohexanoate cleavage protein [Yoonia sediminilitoris]|uniref:3-keto-5-aminohexanoate cleavage protein n=1 Tax=Yoonia sediminilitoris TaxID=1286148 RepID=UPI001FE92CCA|nr:3-keto-5-aminohexanoate cleavage protein [Yoonia sediminilitoris]
MDGLVPILYGANDIALLGNEIIQGRVPNADFQALIVLGRYSAGQQSDPDALAPLVEQLCQVVPSFDWAACAFGKSETECLRRASESGGKVRVGFENNLFDSTARSPKKRSPRGRGRPAMKPVQSPQAAADLIPVGVPIMIGGFMGVSSLNRLIDASASASRKNPTTSQTTPPCPKRRPASR